MGQKIVLHARHHNTTSVWKTLWCIFYRLRLTAFKSVDGEKCHLNVKIVRNEPIDWPISADTDKLIKKKT